MRSFVKYCSHFRVRDKGGKAGIDTRSTLNDFHRRHLRMRVRSEALHSQNRCTSSSLRYPRPPPPLWSWPVHSSLHPNKQSGSWSQNGKLVVVKRSKGAGDKSLLAGGSIMKWTSFWSACEIFLSKRDGSSRSTISISPTANTSPSIIQFFAVRLWASFCLGRKRVRRNPNRFFFSCIVHVMATVHPFWAPVTGTVKPVYLDSAKLLYFQEVTSLPLR